MIQKHTNRVLFLRGVLPVFAVLGLITVIAWPVMNEWREKARAAQSTLALTADEVSLTMPEAGQPAQLQVTKPEFTGLTTGGQPYTVTAARVLQGLKMNAPMTLDQPKATMTLDKEKNQNAALEAASGVYDPKAQTLQLENAVTLTHSDGTTLSMQDLAVDLQSGSAQTQTPVYGTGPRGTLEGQKLELRDSGRHIILHGKSKLVLNPKQSG